MGIVPEMKTALTKEAKMFEANRGGGQREVGLSTLARRRGPERQRQTALHLALSRVTGSIIDHLDSPGKACVYVQFESSGNHHEQRNCIGLGINWESTEVACKMRDRILDASMCHRSLQEVWRLMSFLPARPRRLSPHARPTCIPSGPSCRRSSQSNRTPMSSSSLHE